MSAFSNLSWPQRLEIRRAIEAAGSEMRDYLPEGFSVAIGRDCYAATVAALEPFKFECAKLYTYPLGTDQPPAHLRHDSRGFPACCWLIACFQEAQS
jgi:hypothetical protein